MRKKIRATRALTKGLFGVNLAMPWDQHERLAICLDEGVKVVSFFWGDSSAYMREAKDRGALVMQTVGTPEEARRMPSKPAPTSSLRKAWNRVAMSGPP